MPGGGQFTTKPTVEAHGVDVGVGDPGPSDAPGAQTASEEPSHQHKIVTGKARQAIRQQFGTDLSIVNLDPGCEQPVHPEAGSKNRTYDVSGTVIFWGHPFRFRGRLASNDYGPETEWVAVDPFTLQRPRHRWQLPPRKVRTGKGLRQEAAAADYHARRAEGSSR